jgi:hypothetical protein
VYLSNRLYVIIGLVLISITVCLVLTIGFGMAVSSTDPTSKADTAKMLKDIYDHHIKHTRAPRDTGRSLLCGA